MSNPILLSRGVVLGGTAATTLALIWAVVATGYIAVRDVLPPQAYARDTEMRFTYEDRIGELKQRLEREITAGLVERNGFSARAEALSARQAEIENRQAWLSALLSKSGRPVPGWSASEPPPLLPSPTASTPSPSLALPGSTQKPVPIADGLDRLRSTDAEKPTQAVAPSPTTARDRMSAVDASLERIAASENDLFERLRRDRLDKLARVRSALAATGLDRARIAGRDAPAGGPLIALPNEAASGFGIGAAETVANELAKLLASARALPVAQPLPGELEPTSGFGYRLDPFTRGGALHTGVDFRAEFGAPAQATASGRVMLAEYTGGYGNLVEIDHGNGVTTRYGHLSAYTVSPGMTVEVGQTIGRVGSTGRSTGNHLHYEVRIDGQPVSPTRFIDAGRTLAVAER